MIEDADPLPLPTMYRKAVAALKRRKPPTKYWHSQPINSLAYALGTYRVYSNTHRRFNIRRVVWGMTLARAEKRKGETIKPVTIFVRERTK